MFNIIFDKKAAIYFEKLDSENNRFTLASDKSSCWATSIYDKPCAFNARFKHSINCFVCATFTSHAIINLIHGRKYHIMILKIEYIGPLDIE